MYKKLTFLVFISILFLVACGKSNNDLSHAIEHSVDNIEHEQNSDDQYDNESEQ